MAGGGTEVMLLPGVILPAALSLGPLLEALGDEVDPVAKDLELYAGEGPPPDYTVEVEVEAMLRAADEAGFARFHLLGYSGGGAVCLAFAARHPERLRAFDRPVYFARGSLSNPDYWEPMAERLGRAFGDFTLEVYEGRHHLDPPHRAEPERLAAALRSASAPRTAPKSSSPR